ncbi:MAG: flagellar filament capping protein FliD [Burkholderiales bacterium]|nr:flagellar filament capping protein FliD [Burkholderiales bacterium]
MISTPGIGSGLDVNSIVTKLVALEKQPLQQLQVKASSIQSKLSSYGRLKSELASLQDAAKALQTPSAWGKRELSSADASFTGTATNSATVGNYSVQVTQLAQKQVLTSGAYTAGSSGKLEIRRGEWTGANTFAGPALPTAEINILATDDLASIATKINNAGAGVTASVVNGANGPRLAIKGNDSGAAAGFEIKAFDDGGLPITDGTTGVGILGFAPGASAPIGMSRPSNGTAQNAKALIDGIEVSSATNTFSNAVSGLTLTATATTASAFQVSVTANKTTAKEQIETFVTAFNKISSSLTELTRYDAATKKGAALQGDSFAVGLQNALERIASTVGTGSTAFGRLSDMGIEMQRDGTLKTNTKKFDAALAQPQQLAAFFTDTSGMAAKLKAFATAALASDGTIANRNKALQDSSKRNSVEVERVNTRADQVQNRLLKQYSALDTKVSTNQGLNNFVSQWISRL